MHDQGGPHQAEADELCREDPTPALQQDAEPGARSPSIGTIGGTGCRASRCVPSGPEPNMPSHSVGSDARFMRRSCTVVSSDRRVRRSRRARAAECPDDRKIAAASANADQRRCRHDGHATQVARPQDERRARRSSARTGTVGPRAGADEGGEHGEARPARCGATPSPRRRRRARATPIAAPRIAQALGLVDASRTWTAARRSARAGTAASGRRRRGAGPRGRPTSATASSELTKRMVRTADGPTSRRRTADIRP